jgi:rubrerythrin
MSEEELIKLIKQQIAVEDINVKEVAESEKKVGNAAAKLYLSVIKMDSQKHVEILKGILNFLSKSPPHENLWQYKLESYVDPLVVKKELERHMEREKQMIQHIENEIKKTKDEALKMLLQYIGDEERRHHKIIETILKHT